jgi:hypothetical protein
MAVASRLAVTRVSPDGARPAAAGRGRRSGLAAFPAARKGTRRGGAVAASPPTEEAVQMTEPLTKDDLVAYLVSGCKPKENWRSELRSFHMLLFLFYFILVPLLVAAVECLAWARNSFGCLIRMMMRSYSQQRCLALKLRLLSIAR